MKITDKMATASTWDDPTPEELASPEFEAIWQAIKTWDVNVPDAYTGYCGATGNHAAAILRSLRAFSAAPRVAEHEALESILTQTDSAIEGTSPCGTDGLREKLLDIQASCNAALKAYAVLDYPVVVPVVDESEALDPEAAEDDAFGMLEGHPS